MEKIIKKKIERANKVLLEMEKELKDNNSSEFAEGLHEGQKIVYGFMKEELEDLLWHYERER